MKKTRLKMRKQTLKRRRLDFSLEYFLGAILEISPVDKDRASQIAMKVKFSIVGPNGIYP